MEKKHVSLVGLYYQGKEAEMLKILELASCSSSARKDEQKQSFTFDVNEQDRYGNSIINLALRDAREKLATALWRSGADEMRKDGAGNIPLFLTIKQLYIDLATSMVTAMIPDGIGDDLLNRYEKWLGDCDLLSWCSAFSIVVDIDELKLGKVMMKAGANPLSKNPADGKTPLYKASSFGRIKFVRAMMDFIPSDADKRLLKDAMQAAECKEIRDIIMAKLKTM